MPQEPARVVRDLGKPVVGQNPDQTAVSKVKSIIDTAIKKGASDIHFEPRLDGLYIRYRIDSVLSSVEKIRSSEQAAIISRCKIMAGMNIAERRVGQDGRIAYDANHDIRVSTLPVLIGLSNNPETGSKESTDNEESKWNAEKVVMRILDQRSVLVPRAQLGFLPELENEIEKIITRPNGIFLLTGPTGSGKTTTLYSVLHDLAKPDDKNIETVEDPVEYHLSGVSQSPLNVKAGWTFPKAIRTFLRQDPDIIMVGEMRDLETSETAMQAALTGHLVLSTLHTNDAPSSIARLRDMGVQNFLIGATVRGVLAQRLVKKICTACKTEKKMLRQELGIDQSDEVVSVYHGTGCSNCNNTGYKGRMGIHELLVVDHEIEELVTKGASVNEIRDKAKEKGMKELYEDGIAKVLSGLTTFEEVCRVATQVLMDRPDATPLVCPT